MRVISIGNDSALARKFKEIKANANATVNNPKATVSNGSEEVTEVVSEPKSDKETKAKGKNKEKKEA